MKILKKAVISTRVSTRTRQLAAVAAHVRGVTLSRFVAEAVEEAARRELMGDARRNEATSSGADPTDG